MFCIVPHNLSFKGLEVLENYISEKSEKEKIIIDNLSKTIKKNRLKDERKERLEKDCPFIKPAINQIWPVIVGFMAYEFCKLQKSIDYFVSDCVSSTANKSNEHTNLKGLNINPQIHQTWGSQKDYRNRGIDIDGLRQDGSYDLEINQKYKVTFLLERTKLSTGCLGNLLAYRPFNFYTALNEVRDQDDRLIFRHTDHQSGNKWREELKNKIEEHKSSYNCSGLKFTFKNHQFAKTEVSVDDFLKTSKLEIISDQGHRSYFFIQPSFNQITIQQFNSIDQYQRVLKYYKDLQSRNIISITLVA